MFFAVLVSSLALAIGLAIYDLVVRELQLSTTTAQSQYAIYAADTGVECALYWDFKYPYPNGSTSIFPTSTDDGAALGASGAYCNGFDVTVGRSVVGTANAATTTISLTLQSFYTTVVVAKYSSNNQKVLTPSSGGSITDSSGNVWTLTASGSVFENGSAVPGGGTTSQLTYVSATNTIWGQDAGSGQWYSWNGSIWVGPSAGTPITGSVVHTTIYSHGYNTLATTSSNAVERELQVNY